MKRSSTLLIAAALFFAVGCSKSDNSSSANSQPAVAAPAGTAPAAEGNVALNPAHGLPGHRCDIEVGAPLNSPAAPNLQMPNLATPSGKTGQTAQPQAQPQIQTQSQPQTIQAGMNPPHGEPGHDCAVPVGAPLNK